MKPRLLSCALLACLLPHACGAPEPAGPAPPPPPEEPARAAEPAPPVPAAPWTESFLEPALLFAAEVRIEGPPGLLEHFAARQDADWVEHEARTVPEGFLQEWRVREGAGLDPIRAQLDNLAIAAERVLTVLERPGPVAVTVEGRGDALWQSSGGGERRAESLRLVGERPR